MAITTRLGGDGIVGREDVDRRGLRLLYIITSVPLSSLIIRQRAISVDASNAPDFGRWKESVAPRLEIEGLRMLGQVKRGDMVVIEAVVAWR